MSQPLFSGTWLAAIRFAGWFLFVAAIAWPTMALAVRAVGQWAAPMAGFGFSGRQLGLLWRSVWLAGASAAVATVLAIPAAILLCRGLRGRVRDAFQTLMVVVLLCPPMVYAFGWEQVLPVRFDARARCIGVWALWAWPVPAVLLAAGWMGRGRLLYEAALLETRPFRAIWVALIPLVRSELVLGVLVLFVLFLGDYGVPHACGLVVMATEVLGWASSSTRVVDTLWPALPGMLLIAAALAAALGVARRVSVDANSLGGGADGTGARWGGTVALAYMVTALGLPLGTLVWRFGSVAAFSETIALHGRDVAYSLGTALCGALLCTVMAVSWTVGGRSGEGFSKGALPFGFGLAPMRSRLGARLRNYERGALWWALAMGVLPGALCGGAMIAAYQSAGLRIVYDHPPVVVLANVARFSWIALAVVVFVSHGRHGAIRELAMVDGADAAGVFRHVDWPRLAPVLLAASGVIAALALAEVPATTPVRVPTYSPAAHLVIEKFHRFEFGQLLVLSAALMAAGALAGWCVARTWRRDY